MTAATTATTEPTNREYRQALALTRVSDHVLTTTDPHEPGATLIERSGRRGATWTLVDHGRDLARTAELLYTSWLDGRDVSGLVLLAGHEHSGDTLASIELRDWVPEHVSVLAPAQLSPGGTVLPHVPQSRAYRAGPDQAVIWSPADDVMIAGDLMAPDLPDLAHISPRRAMDGLQYAVAHAPLVAIGSHGHVLSARAQVANGARVETRHLATVADMRMRMDYLRDIMTVAHAGAAQGLTPRAAAHAGWDRGVLSRWSCQDPERQARLNRRHMVNMHSAMASECGRRVDLAAAHADAQALTTP
ncbi:hypothetical protein [Nocardiopsis tropica]|uniref:Metallo-beta-lactamase domain-containing protein n=1 Tax=Nocardiopsis tropica TaxID=109330 RepID=A0ABU7KR72_9ACTN|nr:hypothetical protein [Nocardiopsis umidischolae]MEE2051811.1 hypothetical protein [Nocardiopsis umidischolae]